MNAQQKQANISANPLAIEIVDADYPTFQSAVLSDSAQGGFMETSVRKRIPEWKKPEGAAPLTNIRIRSIMEGVAVKIKISVIFDDSYPADAPGPKYGRSEKQVASYLVREGESVSINELKDFGVVPLVLKVVRATPRIEESIIQSQPILSNNLKSVAVISFEKEGTSSNFYQLTLRNLTAKNIIGLKLLSKSGDQNGGERFTQGSRNHPLMTPGGIFQTHEGGGGSGRGGRMTAQGFVADPPQQETLVIETVIFDDGTYEGNAQDAAKMEAWRRGIQIQAERVLAIIQNTLDTSTNDAATLEKYKSQISALRIDVDPSVAEEIMSLYPNLSEKYSKNNLMTDAMRYMSSTKEMALREIEEFEKLRKRTPEGSDLREWLKKAKTKYEFMLQRSK